MLWKPSEPYSKIYTVYINTHHAYYRDLNALKVYVRHREVFNVSCKASPYKCCSKVGFCESFCLGPPSMCEPAEHYSNQLMLNNCGRLVSMVRSKLATPQGKNNFAIRLRNGIAVRDRDYCVGNLMPSSHLLKCFVD